MIVFFLAARKATWSTVATSCSTFRGTICSTGTRLERRIASIKPVPTLRYKVQQERPASLSPLSFDLSLRFSHPVRSGAVHDGPAEAAESQREMVLGALRATGQGHLRRVSAPHHCLHEPGAHVRTQSVSLLHLLAKSKGDATFVPPTRFALRVGNAPRRRINAKTN